MDISKNIISIRESKGIKQTDIAQRLGIEQSNYSRLEKRGDKLTIEQVKKIAESLNVSLSELLGFGAGNDQTEKINKLEEENKLYKSSWETMIVILKMFTDKTKREETTEEIDQRLGNIEKAKEMLKDFDL